MKKLIIILLIPLVMCLPLTGCWDSFELNKIIIVTGVALDESADGNILFSVISSISKSNSDSKDSSNSNASSIVLSEKGINIMDAYRKIEEKSSRRLFFSHLGIIIISEKLAAKGVSDFLDFFSRYHDANLRTYIMFTKDNANNILTSNPHIELSESEEIKKKEDSNITIKVTLRDFIAMLNEDGEQPIAPSIENVSLVNESSKSNEGTKLSGAAVFKGDKLIGWLDRNEARGLLWAKNQIRSGVVTIGIPETKGGGLIGGNILKSRTKLIPSLDHKKLKITIDIQTELNVYENSSKLDLGDPKVIAYLEKLYSNDISRIVKLFEKKSQLIFNSDTSGLGKAVFNKYPQIWNDYYKKNWEEEFGKLPIIVNCNVTITQTGFYNKTPMREEKDFIK